MSSRNACRLRSSGAAGDNSPDPPRASRRAARRGAATPPRLCLHLVHEHLLRPAVLAPARRARPVPAKSPAYAPATSSSTPGSTSPRTAHGSTNVSASSTGCPCAARMSRDQTAQAQPQRPRRQVRNPALLQHREAGVVRDQVQPRELLLPRPADPRVAHPDLERPGLPAQQRQPGLPAHRHLPQRLAEQPAVGQVVVLRASARPSAARSSDSAHRADLHVPQPATNALRPSGFVHDRRFYHNDFCMASDKSSPETTMHTSSGRLLNSPAAGAYRCGARRTGDALGNHGRVRALRHPGNPGVLS